MTRSELIDKWIGRPWKKSSKSGARYVNITVKGSGYNVAYMPDHNDNRKWTFSVRPIGENGGGFLGKKFDFPDHAKLAALEKAADLLGLA